MDIGKSFSYAFEDEKWLNKLIIGAVVSIIPIVNFAWAGYLVDLVKNIIARQALPLPEWTDFGEKFMKGLYIAVAGLIYALPILCLGSIYATTAGVTLGNMSEQGALDTAGSIFSGSIFSGLALLLGCLMLIYGLALSFFYPAMIIHFAEKPTFGSLFEIGEIIRVATSRLSPYLTAWLIGIVAAIVISVVVGLVSSVLAFIPCLGWIIAWVLGGLSGVYTTVVWAYLFGNVVAETPPAAIVGQ